MDDASSDAARALAEVDALRRRVVNVVGHALRTPVTTLCGMAEALAVADDPETRTALADGVARNARVVERLLDQLLIAAGVTTVLPVGDPSRVVARDVVAAVWNEMRTAATLHLDAHDVVVNVRPSALEQIVFLVLDNAVKYGDGDVFVRGRAGGPRACIEVETRGSGPTDEEMEHAFELFYRGEHAVMRSAGMGMGLTVARELARFEGGDVALFRRDSAVVTSIELPA
jgi:two-component system, OmpR family, phosphate regulon sensor histidine kinase PhoR